MEEPVKDTAMAVDPLADRTDLSPEQRELLRSLHRSFQQAERGETRPAREFMEEWRLEREAKSNARPNGA